MIFFELFFKFFIFILFIKFLIFAWTNWLFPAILESMLIDQRSIELIGKDIDSSKHNIENQVCILSKERTEIALFSKRVISWKEQLLKKQRLFEIEKESLLAEYDEKVLQKRNGFCAKADRISLGQALLKEKLNIAENLPASIKDDFFEKIFSKF